MARIPGRSVLALVVVLLLTAWLSGCSVIMPTSSLPLGSASGYVGQLRWPLGSDSGRLNSEFGYRGLSFHEGVDIPGKEGSPVYAAHDGVVIYSGNKLNGYGNMVVLKGEGLLTVYAHHQRNKVSNGEFVRAGKQIAAVGMTGNASGPHLHFETRIADGEGKWAAVDPLAFYLENN